VGLNVEDFNEYTLMYLDTMSSVIDGTLRACEECERAGAWKTYCPLCGDVLTMGMVQSEGRECVKCAEHVENDHAHCHACGQLMNDPSFDDIMSDPELRARFLEEEAEMMGVSKDTDDDSR
jgi:RNA polymerase subunit RPABC4/transcription elongation factor Spt4